MDVGRILAAVAALLVCFMAQPCAADGPCAVCNGPGCVDFWVVDTRCPAYCGDVHENLQRIAYFHCEPTGWVRYTLEGFSEATNSELPVCFYVHGIFSTSKSALKQSRTLFGTVGAGLPAFRGVLWSWPSDFECGMSIPDQVDRGIAHTPKEAFYLATVIDALGARVPVNLVGHSLGTRIVVASLHGLSERNIDNQELPEPKYREPRAIRTALLAAAIDPYALWPGRQYGGAVSQVDRILVCHNPEDRVLRADERIFGRRALGLRGLPIPADNAENAVYFRDKVEQVNSNPAVGKRHLPSVYFESPMVAVWLRNYISYPQPEPAPPPPDVIVPRPPGF
jgi:pimeloyl-ACP methyl ester carboxylesterase